MDIIEIMTDDDRLATTFAALTAEDGERHPPFLWQVRLLRRLIRADLPRAVDIPTGLGKTSIMGLWLIALAEGAKLPRRLVYVVDRRAVVDQATRFAERLRLNLTPDLAERLRLNDCALPISTLRGEFADNRDWLEDPASPAIVVGTIDMIGSRLLFEGYGVSRGMRPYHAGFLGVDTLVLLDEAHLCPPFEALLRQVEAHRDGKLGPTPGRTPVTPGEAAKIDVAAECVRRGLPTPAEIDVLDVRAGPRGGRPTADLKLHFAVAVRGPLFLGRDSHVGGGVFHAAP